MSQTTDAQLQAMRALCDQLDSSIVKRAHIDDWGRFGNFTLLVTPQEHSRRTTQQLKTLVRSRLPAGAHIRKCFPPQATRTVGVDGKRQVGKYDRGYWTFDVDFMKYDAATNTFSNS